MGNKRQSHAKRWGVERKKGERLASDSAQLSFDMAVTHGGRRVGAGRPKTLKRANVRHDARGPRAGWIPAHVTLRRVAGFADFRLAAMHDAIVSAIRDSQRDDFRIVQYSIQRDHLHLLVEADGDVLGRGMCGFSTRVVKRIHRVAGTRGKVFAERYHRHDLRTPREVRHALVYILANGVKHGEVAIGQLDPFSSARYFDGWATPAAGSAANDLPDRVEEKPVRAAESWLLRAGWLKVWPGYLLPTETPKAARR